MSESLDVRLRALVETWKQRASSERLDEQASSAEPGQSSYWAGRSDAGMDAVTDLEALLSDPTPPTVASDEAVGHE
jgi:hypothetical protein